MELEDDKSLHRAFFVLVLIEFCAVPMTVNDSKKSKEKSPTSDFAPEGFQA